MVVFMTAIGLVDAIGASPEFSRIQNLRRAGLSVDTNSVLWEHKDEPVRFLESRENSTTS